MGVDGVMIRDELPEQPYQLDVPLTLPFQTPGRSDSVQIAVNKKFEQVAWMMLQLSTNRSIILTGLSSGIISSREEEIKTS